MKTTQLNGQRQTEIRFAIWVRAISAVLIFLCHLTQTHTNPYLIMSSQITNVGVNIFIVLSGFLFGRIGVKPPYRKWFAKRFKRIFIPFWIFLVVLISAQYFVGTPIPFSSFIYSFFGAHGFTYVFPGSEHTWFVTAILICYCLTPCIEWCLQKLLPLGMKMIVTAATILLAVCTVLCCVYSGSIPITPIPFYIIAYGMGRLWDTEKDQPRRPVLVLSIGVVAFVVRFVLRNWYDGTIFYDRVIAPYTHYVAAFSFFVASARIFNKKPGRITHFISDISFEIYLYHYMFLWPPFSLMHITNSWILNSAIAIVATLITAWFMHIINNMVQRIAEKSLCFRESKS